MGSPAKTVVIAESDVEDRARVVEVVTGIASQAGVAIELHETDDGEDADRLIAESEPDLVVCEILLDKVSGLELLRKQRSRHGEDAVPFIFVTHMTAETDRYWGLRNGAFAYVMKPYEPSTLERRVRKALGQPAKPSSATKSGGKAAKKPAASQAPPDIEPPPKKTPASSKSAPRVQPPKKIAASKTPPPPPKAKPGSQAKAKAKAAPQPKDKPKDKGKGKA